MLNFRRIKAILWQEWFVLYRSGEVITDIIIFPVGHIVVFGFISLFLSKENPEIGQMVLLGMLLWQVIWIVEYALTLGSLWNIWSRNLTNLFIAPLRLSEYIFAHTFSGVIKAFIVLLFGGVLSHFVFDFNVLSVGIGALVLSFVNFSIFAYALGLGILGLIFRYGTRVQAAAWGLVTILQPFMAPFYPVDVMPVVLQYTAYLFPATYTFEAARYSLLNHGEIAWSLFGIALLMNIVYCVLCTMWFRRLYDKSRDSGQFARNEV